MKINSIHKISLLALLLLLVVVCESTKSTNLNTKETVSKITMEKTTLGNSSVLEVNKKQVLTLSKEKNGEENTRNSSTKPEHWQEINRLVSGLDMNEMSNWEAPTQARFYDGARATIITIESDGQTFTSQSFDEGKPPAQLKKLYDYLESLVNQ